MLVGGYTTRERREFRYTIKRDAQLDVDWFGFHVRAISIPDCKEGIRRGVFLCVFRIG